MEERWGAEVKENGGSQGLCEARGEINKSILSACKYNFAQHVGQNKNLIKLLLFIFII
jgi:hypothetical protein